MDPLVPTVLSTQTESWRGVPVVLAAGEVDMSTAAQLGTAIDDALVPGLPLVVSLAGVQFIDSAGTHTLALADRAVDGQGGALMIVTSEFVARVLEVSGLDRAFRLYGELSEALTAATGLDAIGLEAAGRGGARRDGAGHEGPGHDGAGFEGTGRDTVEPDAVGPDRQA